MRGTKTIRLCILYALGNSHAVVVRGQLRKLTRPIWEGPNALVWPGVGMRGSAMTLAHLCFLLIVKVVLRVARLSCTAKDSAVLVDLREYEVCVSSCSWVFMIGCWSYGCEIYCYDCRCEASALCIRRNVDDAEQTRLPSNVALIYDFHVEMSRIGDRLCFWGGESHSGLSRVSP